MPVNPEYLTCRIAQMDDFIDRLEVEIATHKRLRNRTLPVMKISLVRLDKKIKELEDELRELKKERVYLKSQQRRPGSR